MTINDFRGEYAFLSNHWPVLITFDGEVYPSVEHAYQAAKTDDPALKKEIQSARSAADAKKIGRHVLLVADWDNKRLDVMASLIKQKFSENLDLKLKLLMTGTQELVQGGMRRDDFWGVTTDGDGENHLGKILMNTRDAIRAQEGSACDVLCAFLQSRKLEFVADLIRGPMALNDDQLDTPEIQVIQRFFDK